MTHENSVVNGPHGAFQSVSGEILWRTKLRASAKEVFRLLATDTGRSQFWAERTKEADGEVRFWILNYPQFSGRVIQVVEPHVLELEYYGTIVRFDLAETLEGGVELKMHARSVSEHIKSEMCAGWVSVLMNLKAVADFGVDLRNHDPDRGWLQGFVEN